MCNPCLKAGDHVKYVDKRTTQTVYAKVVGFNPDYTVRVQRGYGRPIISIKDELLEKVDW